MIRHTWKRSVAKKLYRDAICELYVVTLKCSPKVDIVV